MKLQLNLISESGREGDEPCAYVLEIRKVDRNDMCEGEPVGMQVRLDIVEHPDPMISESVLVVTPMGDAHVRNFPFSNTLDLSARVLTCINDAFTEDHEMYADVFSDGPLTFDVPTYGGPVTPDGALDSRGRP